MKKGRDYIRRHCDQANNAIDNALYHLHQIDELYKGKYPTHSEALRLIAVPLIQCQELISEFRKR